VLKTRDKIPVVSVIIPVFNRSLQVKEAIDSVLAQTYEDFELIVIDDGSTDRVQEELQCYYDRINYLRQENRGVSSARNRGIAEAKGDLIAFLDSDDLWQPAKLSVQVDFFNKHSDALICQTEEIWIRNGRRVNPKNRHKKPSGMIFEPSLSLCLVSPSAVMMKKELFEKVGCFDETLPACEDYDLWLRVGCRYPVYLIDKPLTIKRGGHKDQLSKSPVLDQYRVKAIKKILESGALSKVQFAAAAATLSEKCDILAAGCIKRGHKDRADCYINLARRFQKKSCHALNLF
jgi:glycosyltransferase involved in cell wall biosynthesis